MSHPPLADQTDKDLLQKYEPVLYFAPGEKFYPMRVEDFVDTCQIKEYLKFRPDRLVQNKADIEYITGEGASNPNLYLQYVHNPSADARVWLSNFLNWVSPEYGRRMASMLSRYLVSLIWPLIFTIALVILLFIAGVNYWVLIRLAVVIYLVFLGLSFSGAYRQTFLTIILNTFAILFIGSTVGIFAGVTAAFVTAGIFLIMGPRPRNFKQWFLVLGGFCLLVILALLPLWVGKWPDYREDLFWNSHWIEWIFYCVLFILSIPFWSLIAKGAKGQVSFLIAVVFFTLVILVSAGAAVRSWNFINPLLPDLATNVSQTDYNAYVTRIGLIWAMIGVVTAVLWLYLDPNQQPGRHGEGGEKLCWSSDWNKGVTFLVGIAITIWLAATLIFQVSDPVSKLALIVFVILANLFFADLILRGKDIALFLTLGSGQSNAVAERAAQCYTDKRNQSAEKWCYYGRVMEDPENDWKTLQYHYFYAYNDWRRAADGINHHEGDWEAIAVYLRDGDLYGVAYSMHNQGSFLFKEDLIRENLLVGDSHPKAFVALGSHANYPGDGYEGEQPIGDQLSGSIEKIFIGYDRLVTRLHTWFEKLEYYTQDEDIRIICPTIQLLVAEMEWEALSLFSQECRETLHALENAHYSPEAHNEQAEKENELVENIIQHGVVRQRIIAIQQRLIEETSNLTAATGFKPQQQTDPTGRKGVETQQVPLYKKVGQDFGTLMETRPVTTETPVDECPAKLNHLSQIGQRLMAQEKLHPMIKKARDHFYAAQNKEILSILTNKDVGQRILDLVNNHNNAKFRISCDDIRDFQEKPKFIMAGLFKDVTQHTNDGLIIGVLDKNKDRDLFQIDWSCKILNDNQAPWTDFKGLWGKATFFAGESGPTGPKWQYYTKDGEQLERDRWQLEEWKDKLLLEILYDTSETAAARKQALNALMTNNQHSHPDENQSLHPYTKSSSKHDI